MRQPSPTLKRVLTENGWRYSEESGPCLHIEGETVRYYNYPDEKYNLALRSMILRNTLAEMESALPADLNPGTALSINELRANLRRLSEHAAAMHHDTPAEAIAMQAVAVTEFKLGGALLLDVLNKLAQGAEYETVREQYKEGIDNIARAHNHGEFNNLEILGRQPHMSANAQRKLSLNIRDIVDFEEPVETLITQWYHKIAMIKKAMRARVEEAAGPRSDPGTVSLRLFSDSCAKLLEARRNEPEYAMAQVNAATEFVSLQQKARHNTRLLDAAHDIYWMARMREPLTPQIEPRSSVKRYA
ncbi:MAG: hypothetical protein EBV03_07475 [Proteobacteria bacterium]|nr:hypothetical protein [Pseudomonadota bacterium]